MSRGSAVFVLITFSRVIIVVSRRLLIVRASVIWKVAELVLIAVETSMPGPKTMHGPPSMGGDDGKQHEEGMLP